MISTYTELSKIVAPTLQAYHEDLTKHDLNALTNYNGKFLYGYRPYGTDLLRMKDSFEEYKEGFKKPHFTGMSDEELIKIIREDIIWITYPERNVKFLYFDGARLKRISQQEAKDIYAQHITDIFRQYEMKKQLQENKF